MNWHIVLVGLILLSAAAYTVAGEDAKEYSAPGIGYIEIRSDIDGARVYFDTLYMGYVSGGSLTVPVDTTVHPVWRNVRMEYTGYIPFTGPFVQTEPGKTIAYRIDLNKDSYERTGIVSFLSDPAGAEFSLNEISIGSTPDSGTLVYYTAPRGLYSVSARRPGDTTITDDLYIDDNAVTNYRVNLIPSPTGSLLVQSEPEGGDVFLDNALKGFTPLEMADIATGEHKVQVRMDGFEDWAADVSVIGGSTGSVNAVLVPGSSPVVNNSTSGIREEPQAGVPVKQ